MPAARVISSLFSPLRSALVKMTVNTKPMSDPSTSSPPAASIGKDDVRDTVKSFLARCDIPYVAHVPYDHELEARVRAEGARRGYSMEGPDSLEPFIPMGVMVGATSFTHIPSKPTQVHICLYASLAIYVDDAFEKDPDAIAGFNERFYSKQPHKDKVLDDWADLLRRVPEYFDRLPANIMVSSLLDFVTACYLEHEMGGIQVDPSGLNYAVWARRMSGAADSLALSIFPREMPINHYIQALPDIAYFINGLNDILSFYKEELEGDTVNYISLLANYQNIPKLEVFRHVADQAVAAHASAVRILSPYKETADAFRHFSRGYVSWHTCERRYKLDELDLPLPGVDVAPEK
ncbi:hypothetical protein PLICRDRAFT_56281 [Plicaturopsis crispa FD-325 SS-3]|nr:hypothetical protein PLICRDRAFT_56281 [Plicaturopsis crispa FD-325 SS-3]